MAYLLMILAEVVGASQGMFTKQYTIRSTPPVPIWFAAISVFFSMMYLVISGGWNFTFSMELLPYAIGLGLMTAINQTTGILALREGPLSLSSLIGSYTIMIPILHGIFLLKETITPAIAAGIVLFMICMFLVSKKEKEVSFSFKWIVFVVMSLTSNGIALVVMKMQQTAFTGAYKNEFMIIGQGLAFLLLLAMTIIQRGDVKGNLKYSILFGIPKGITVAVYSVLLLVLVNLMPAMLLYPLLTGLSMAITLVVSLFVYKEKLTKQQIAGYCVGVVSIILLNL